MTQRPPEFDRLPDHLAKRVLARASEIDAAGAAVTDLREAAREAGISPAAFEAALAEVQDVPVPVRKETPRAAPPRRWFSGAVVGGVGMLLFLIMAVFIPRAVQRAGPASDEVAISEQIFRLNCISGNEAGLLVRPVIKSPYGQVTISPQGSPQAMVVRGTAEELQAVKALLEQRDGVPGQACAVPPGTSTKTP
jgi:hypothetical protein